MVKRHMWTIITMFLLLVSFIETNRLIKLQQQIENTGSNVSILILEIMSNKNDKQDGDENDELI